MNKKQKAKVKEVILGFLVPSSTTNCFRLICDNKAQRLIFEENSLVYARHFIVDLNNNIIEAEVLGYTGNLTLENPHNDSIFEHVMLSNYGAEMSDSMSYDTADQLYLDVTPIACINVKTGEPLPIKIPPTRTKFYLANGQQVERYYNGRASIFRIGFLSGTDVPIGLDVRHFGKGPMGWADARMLGVAGRTGSGKTILVGQLITAHARHKEMGILIVDPQGQYSSCDTQGNYVGELSKNPHRWSWKLRDSFDYAQRLNDVFLLRHSQVCLGNDIDAFLSLLHKFKFWEMMRSGIKGEKINISSSLLRDFLEKIVHNQCPLGSIVWSDSLCFEIQNMIAASYAKPQEELEQMLQNPTNVSKAAQIWQDIISYFDARIRPYTIEDVVKAFLIRRKIVIFSHNTNQSTHSNEREEYIQKLYIRKLFSSLHRKAEGIYFAAKQQGVESDINGLIVLDEAQRIIPEDTESDPLKQEIVALVQNCVNTGRKLGIGWLFATQSVVNINKGIWRQVGTTFIGYGFGIGADKTRLLETIGNNMTVFNRYNAMPQPLQTNRYWFVVQGELVALGNGNQSLFIDCFSSQAQMFQLNPK